jgi:DNA-directed RNA polymerase subunit RPC12/RpoP
MDNNNKLVVKCPNCSSTNTQKISGTSKAASALAFGIFSMGKLTKTWECKTCKYRW